jgi:hypothetical protein
MERMSLPTSPYGTIGPFFPGEFADGCGDLTNFAGNQARGEHILLTGTVVEEGNRPIRNAIVEIWQPDANGIFRHPLDPRSKDADPGFFGWGRARTDAEGRYVFRTVMPGAYATEDGAPRCPHLNSDAACNWSDAPIGHHRLLCRGVGTHERSSVGLCSRSRAASSHVRDSREGLERRRRSTRLSL